MAESNPPSLPGQSIDDGRGRIFPCPQCGSDLVFKIGHQSLGCPFCGHLVQIELSPDAEVREQDFHDALNALAERKRSQTAPTEQNEVRCESCGANVLFEGTLTSTTCPYCGSPIQRENVHRGGFRIPVDGVIPFRIPEEKANELFTRWVHSRWFAPGDFRHAGERGKLNGVYLPYWTFDAMTFNRYRGERGERYTVTTGGTGKDSKSETRVRWTPASGSFQKFFDDVLIHAATGLPATNIARLAPWPLNDAIPFTPEFLAGFFSRTYDIDLDDAFLLAKREIEHQVHALCRSRIGGDEQRLHHVDCRMDAITYKHLLLPVWMLAYRYRDRSYRVFVNALTGNVQGERPYSWLKITFAALCVLAVVLLIAGLLNSR